MKKILVFAGSNNNNSINHKLATLAARLLKTFETNIIELKNFKAPIYSMDIEKDKGFPKSMLQLNQLIKNCDGMIISLPEHNGSLTPVFKNTVDWISRIESPIFKNKPILLLSTSPGKRGGKTNLTHVISLMPYWGGKIISSYSLPSFNESVDINTMSLVREEDHKLLQNAIDAFEKEFY